jgi:hypothetical protein
MSSMLLPGPDDAANPLRPPAGQANQQRRRASSGKKRRRSRGTGQIPTAEQCLAMLNHLAALVALGTISTAQAGVLRSIYQTILQHHSRQATPTPQALGGAELLDKLRADPELVNLLEPLLPDDLLAELLEEPGEDPRDESV